MFALTGLESSCKKRWFLLLKEELLAQSAYALQALFAKNFSVQWSEAALCPAVQPFLNCPGLLKERPARRGACKKPVLALMPPVREANGQGILLLNQ